MIKYTIKNLHLAIWQTVRMAGYELFIVTNLPYQCCNKEGFAADVAVGDIMKKIRKIVDLLLSMQPPANHSQILLNMYSHMKCTKYETCAILHRFHILYISCICSCKIKLSDTLTF